MKPKSVRKQRILKMEEFFQVMYNWNYSILGEEFLLFASQWSCSQIVVSPLYTVYVEPERGFPEISHRRFLSSPQVFLSCFSGFCLLLKFSHFDWRLVQPFHLFCQFTRWFESLMWEDVHVGRASSIFRFLVVNTSTIACLIGHAKTIQWVFLLSKLVIKTQQLWKPL